MSAVNVKASSRKGGHMVVIKKNNGCRKERKKFIRETQAAVNVGRKFRKQ